MVPWRYYVYVVATVCAVFGAIYVFVGLAGKWMGPEVGAPVFIVVTVAAVIATNRQMR